nr:hypothetical protein [uncultured Actinoplanes sp.]
MEVLVVVENPQDYRAAIDTWRRTASVIQELPPRLAVCHLRGEAPDVPGVRWYTGEVPPDVLLRLDPAARIFIAAWHDRRRPAERPGNPTWSERGYLEG